MSQIASRVRACVCGYRFGVGSFHRGSRLAFEAVPHGVWYNALQKDRVKNVVFRDVKGLGHEW